MGAQGLLERQEDTFEQRTIKTVAKRKNEWLENAKANAPFIRKDISMLWNDHGFGEGVSVAAGPSLSNREDLERLVETSKGREVICADACYQFLRLNGIVPRFVLATDASDKVADMLSNADQAGTTLILNVTASSKIASKVWKGEIYWFIGMNNFYDSDNEMFIQNMHILASKIGGKLVPGGNVSSLMLGFMLSVRNVDKLYLFGHDFCWKTDMYCGGMMKDLEKQRMAEEGRAGTIIKTKNTMDEDVTTNLSLKSYSDWHAESGFSTNGRVINATSSTILKNVIHP